MAKNNGKGGLPTQGATGLIQEQQTAQAKLRAAVYSGVSEADVAEIVAGVVTKAKKGDRVALKVFFDHILGGQINTAVQNNYYNDATPPAPAPTPAIQGSAEKVGVLAGRFARGEALHSPADR